MRWTGAPIRWLGALTIVLLSKSLAQAENSQGVHVEEREDVVCSRTVNGQTFYYVNLDGVWTLVLDLELGEDAGEIPDCDSKWDDERPPSDTASD